MRMRWKGEYIAQSWQVEAGAVNGSTISAVSAMHACEIFIGL